MSEQDGRAALRFENEELRARVRELKLGTAGLIRLETIAGEARELLMDILNAEEFGRDSREFEAALAAANSWLKGEP